MQANKLTCGAATLEFHQGNLRYIKVGEQEIVRSIYFAVRDENWGTLPCNITSFNLNEKEKEFEIGFVAEFGHPLVFKANCKICGESNGTISYAFEGEMHADFKRNRIGFCILHPIKECVGQFCKLIHPDQSITASKFPEFISPHQPFKQVSGMEWNLEVTKAKLSFEGELFETEDQRNWIDASYKTYCTPLDLPFPTLVKKGEIIAQKVVLSIETKHAPKLQERNNTLQIIENQHQNIPPLGLQYANKQSGLTNNEIEKLKVIGLSHLRFDVKFDTSNWIEVLQQLLLDAEKLNCKLELCLHIDETFETSIDLLINCIDDKSMLIGYISILSLRAKATLKNHLEKAVPVIRKAFPDAKIGAGTDYDFTDLNRFPVELSDIDYVFYSACPQVHAFDNLSLIENLEGLSETIKSAKMLAPEKQINVSAITLKRRSNPDATSNNTDIKEQYFKKVDARQWSQFGALWTLGALKNCWEHGADLVTLFETTGACGIMMNDNISELDIQYSITAGEVYPVYNLLKSIAQFKPTEIVKTESSNPLKFDGMLLKNGKSEIIIVANYTADLISVNIQNQVYPIDIEANSMVYLRTNC
jgi:hypothetical protein